MKGKPTEVPSLDALAADPSKASHLPPDIARQLLYELAGVLPVLLAQASKANTAESSAPAQQNGHYLTVQQVAERLGVKASYAYELCRQGELESVRIGKKYVRVLEQALGQYQARLRR